MDPEQTFIRVQDRFSQILTPRLRAALEYIYLFTAITLFCILVVMHANYVQQPGCSSEFSEVETADSQLIRIKITSAGLWFQNETGFNEVDAPYTKRLPETSPGSHNSNPVVKKGVGKASEDPHYSFVLSAKETLRAAVFHFGRKWHRRLSFIWRHVMQIAGSFCKLWDIAAVYVNLDVPKWLHILHLDRLNSYAVQFLEKRSKAFEPTYLYTMEKGYFLLSEASKSRHNIHTINISISARHPCFGNRWQQLIINRFVGYDTILMNSLLNSPGVVLLLKLPTKLTISSLGYLYNYQTKEFYNLSYVKEPPEGPAKFGDYVVTKCGVLMMSLFVFFTTTMSVSFTLRETQTRMLKFTVQLQHHASHQLPTFELIFVHVIESLVFVPIMIGILFFLFEFYDDQLLAFMVLILVWLCELFTLISVRTPISMKFFPRFFLLYFLVFHIYFFSYAYGFSYLALGTTAAFMQHLILYFWNRFEVPALQRFMQNGRSQLQRHPDFHITSSTFLASMFHITRLNTRSSAPGNPDSRPGPNQAAQPGGPQAGSGTRGQVDGDDHDHVQQAEAGADPGALNSVSSLLL